MRVGPSAHASPDPYATSEMAHAHQGGSGEIAVMGCLPKLDACLLWVYM
jgi:hypothetical protein